MLKYICIAILLILLTWLLVIDIWAKDIEEITSINKLPTWYDEIQDDNISDSTKTIKDEIKQRKIKDRDLKQDINKETKERISEDKQLQKNINTEETQRKKQDNILNNKITTETTQRKNADIKINDNINKETNNRTLQDNKLNKKIDINISDIVKNTDNIKTVDKKHTAWNKRQDITLNDHESRIQNNSNRLDKHEERIGELEETQINIAGEIDFIRKENLTVGLYSKYDIRHSRVPDAGIIVRIGFGKSEAQEKREALEKRIVALENKLDMIGAEPRVEKTKNGYKISISEDNMGKVLKRF